MLHVVLLYLSLIQEEVSLPAPTWLPLNSWIRKYRHTVVKFQLAFLVLLLDNTISCLENVLSSILLAQYLPPSLT